MNFLEVAPARILVADDTADMRHYYSRILPRLGFEVVGVAENGEQLVDLSRSSRPDVLVADIDMPIMCGLEAIRKFCVTKRVPAVVVSGNPDAPDADNFPHEHVYAFLLKPISMHQLKVGINSAFNRIRHPNFF